MKEIDLIVRRTMLHKYHKIARKLELSPIKPFARRGEIFMVNQVVPTQIKFGQVGLRIYVPYDLVEQFDNRVLKAEEHSLVGWWRRIETRRKEEMKQYANPDIW